MTVRERLERVARGAAARPRLTLAVVAVLALAGSLFALTLKADTSNSTFVSSSSASYKATQDWHNHFGDDAIVILVKEPLTDLVETADLGALTELEACLAGQEVIPNQQLGAFTPAPAGQQKPYGGAKSPCAKLMAAKPVQVVYGPGTFLNRAVAAVNQEVVAMINGVKTSTQQAEAAARQLAQARHLSPAQVNAAANAAGTIAQQQAEGNLAQLALQSGITSLPSIDNPQFIPQVVFDSTRGVNQPKARFAYLFPTANAALIEVRLKPSLSDDQRAQAIHWVRQAVAMPLFASKYGGTYTVSGAPVVLHDLSSDITGSIAVLLIAALAVMAIALMLVFRSRMRLLPLLLALAATGITFGATRLFGGSLTMASIAVLPVLIGLAVDYGIQFQSRTQEARAAASEEAGDASAEEAVGRAAAVGAPTIGAAALATATGFLVLLLSPVPMVRGFGLLLVVGIGIAFAVALTAGSAAITLGDRSGGRVGASLRGAVEILRDLGRTIGRPLRAAGRLLAKLGRPLRRPAAALGHVRELPGAVTRNPRTVLAVAAALAAIGWVADTQTSVQSDVTKLVPSSMPALRDLNTLEKVTGVSGELDVTVRAPDVTDPKIVGWMTQYEKQLLAHYGYLQTKGCAKATLCPALSLPDLFSGGGGSSTSAASLTKASINALLSAVPPYFSEAVITPDHREATLAFGIRLMPLSRQQQVINYMQRQLHPPAGATASLVGLPVLAAEANSALSSSGRRLLMLIAGLLAVGLVLRLLLRETERALIPLIPIALATGWSALVLFATRIPLNPMSATLGALVIAISTEFSVLLSERFRQERQAGHDLHAALARTYNSTGAAVLASGATAIAGFGVLVFSSITMLRDFGFVTVIDLTVSLAGVLLVLPAVLVIAERDDVVGTERRQFAIRRPLRLRRRARTA